MSELFPVVRSWDLAIDHERCSVEKYRESRDFETLRFVAERKPMIFWLRDVDSRAINDYLLTATTDEQRRIRAFRMAVVRVDNLRHPDGRTEDHWEPKRYEQAKRVTKLTEIYDLFSDTELVLFRSTTQQEIGEVARTRFFSEDEIEPIYQVPGTSVQILVTQVLRRAEQAAPTVEAGTHE